jgi:UDP-3-O-acyl-N-acetylglucosamine deacetylase
VTPPAFPNLQCTIRSPVRFSHRGMLTGRVTSVRLRPGAPDTGIVFNGSLPALLRHAFVENHFVNLGDGRETVLAVEHLLAACYGLGIDNLQVEVVGGEVPFGDGSALPFTRILQAAGLKRSRATRVTQVLRQPIVVQREDSFICALPVGPDIGTEADLRVEYFVSFPEPCLGEQFCSIRLNPADFPNSIGSARTFWYRSDGQVMPAWLARSGSQRGNVTLPARPRFADEPVRHKVLDLLGDLCLLGRQLSARIFAYKAGHRLHHDLVGELEDQWK